MQQVLKCPQCGQEGPQLEHKHFYEQGCDEKGDLIRCFDCDWMGNDFEAYKPKEHPILFSGPMVRAILAGRKTQTRRIMKTQPKLLCDTTASWFNRTEISSDGIEYPGELVFGVYSEDRHWKCPYGAPKDRLWVRETWAYVTDYDGQYILDKRKALYRADEEGCIIPSRWRPSIHMPRSVSRINLEITSVRVEQLNDISNEDCRAEGCEGGWGPNYSFAKTAYKNLWESINGKESWELNPWCWVVEFKRV